jgi:protein disulfide-isomerase A1
MKKFTFPGTTKSVTFDEISTFVEEFRTGSLKAFLKSAEPPADNTEPVKVIVGKTYRDIVIDNDNDVLVKYYAPWCGHCKKLAPIWDQVAADLKDVPNLVIAKFDATANEVEGLEVKGYPTLKFYKAGSKSSPVDFDGERGAEDIKAWLKENSPAYKKYLETKETKGEL